MKILMLTIFIMCNFAHAEPTTFDNEPLQLAKTSATKGAIASVDLVPFFWFLNKKTNLQQRKSDPVSYSRSFISGVKAMPNVASTLSIQFFTGDLIKSIFKKKQAFDNEAYLEVIGCVSGAIFSAPWYAVMNGKTMKLSRAQALGEFCKRPFSAGWPIIARESCFLLGLQASDPFSRAMKKQFGNNVYVENTSCFASGFAGSIFGHLFDTILTCKQAKIPWQWMGLMNGGMTKGIGIGCFAVALNHSMKLKKEYMSEFTYM
ncbi:MAG: hypothetical protein NTX76_02140 [Alphaproteobacteria bacterium]|nr:hypothetical protein [Alphaproteobacteria bacterium]